MARRKKNTDAAETSANVGYEAQLWQMADARRGSMDAAEYKHVTLGLLFLNNISDAFEKKHPPLLIDMISNIRVGDEASRAKDVLGHVYEYFLSQFASSEGKKGGEFYTPRCVVKLLVEMLEPYRGRVYDPCCGSSGMFMQSVEFIRAHAKGNGDCNKSSRTRPRSSMLRLPPT